MKLVGEARRSGIRVSVADVFRCPTISLLAEIPQVLVQISDDFAPFSLLGKNSSVKKHCEDISRAYDFDADSIEDIYPCTPLQEGLIALTSKQRGDYIAQNVVSISDDVELGRFQDAWETVFQLVPILRTRIAEGPSGLVQVVLKESIRWSTANNLSKYLCRDKAESMGLGEPLARFALVSEGASTTFILTLHHALYDGGSFPKVRTLVHEAYHQHLSTPTLPGFRFFVKYIMEQEERTINEYWRSELSAFESPPFPSLPTAVRQPLADASLTERIILPSFRKNSEATLATFARAAWAFVVSRNTGSDDVVFGATVSGRQAPVPRIEEIIGPTLATIPVRVRINSEATVSAFIRDVQNKAASAIPYEQAGLQQIAKASPEAQQACEFQTLLIIQPAEDESASPDDGLGVWQEDIETALFSTYALTLTCYLGDEIKVVANYDSRVLPPWRTKSLLQQLNFTLCQMTEASADQTLGQMSAIPPSDLLQFWGWNKEVPQTVDRFVHEIIRDRRRAQPEALAISSWDGELTYGELDGFISRLSRHLVDQYGVGPGMVLPLCFEKSMWTVVAFLATLEAGAGFMLLDPALPEARLQLIVSQVNFSVLLSSPATHALGCRLSDITFSVGPDMNLPLHNRLQKLSLLPTLTPHFLSLASPKVQSYPIEALGYNSESRHCDFSAYSFDISIHNAIGMLATGGTLLIPSDQDRKSNVRGALISMQATSTVLTPSVARLVLKEGIPPTLNAIGLVGEALTTDDVQGWLDAGLKVTNLYGPSECTSYSTVTRSAVDAWSATALDTGAGCATWIVDPNDHNILLPLGPPENCYWKALSLERSTSMTLRRRPRRTSETRPSSRRVLQVILVAAVAFTKRAISLTMALVTGVFTSGQRVELGEVEHGLRESVLHAPELAAEVISPATGDEQARSLLAAFLVLEEGHSFKFHAEASGGKSVDLGVEGVVRVVALPSDAEDTLMERLPLYMVPTVYFVLDKLPINNSGKTDRRKLRQIGAMFSAEQLAHLENSGERHEPTTETEFALRKLWSTLFHISPEKIGVDDNFFRLGGDSIAAIKLVGESRRAGLGDLSVADIFQHPKLGAMANLCLGADDKSVARLSPFSLLGADANATEYRKQIADLYGFDAEAIEDIYPCTPLQEGMVALTAKSHGQYILQRVMDVAENIDMNRLRAAWDEVARLAPILRTRIVQHNQHGLLQLILAGDIAWTETNKSLVSFLDEDMATPMELGEPLVRYAIVHDPETARKQFVWTIHHALFDARSVPMLRELVANAYQRQTAPHDAFAGFNIFVKHVAEQNGELADHYWQSFLAGYDSAPFPMLPVSVPTPNPDATLETSFSLSQPNVAFTAATVLRAAWALSVASEGSRDVVFGATVSGRQAPVAGVESIIGPTIATVPVRIQVPNRGSVFDYLESIQKQSINMVAFEQTGLQRIGKVSNNAQQACDFQTLLVIQPPEDQEDDNIDSALGQWKERAYTDVFSTYALTLVCYLSRDSVRVVSSFDSAVLDGWKMKTLLQRFNHFFQQLNTTASNRGIRELDVVTDDDLNQLWEWNAKVPSPATDVFVHSLFEQQALSQPNRPAIHAWDAKMSYSELNSLADELSSDIMALNVSNTSVPVCFEKSAWAVVSMLAVLKSGNTFILLDPSQPKSRLRSIIHQTGSQLLLCSVQGAALLKDFGDRIWQINPSYFSGRTASSPHNAPIIDPASNMYIVFTSGSTGAPKGVMVPHESFASAIAHQTQLFGFGPKSRHYDFMSYSFDASIWNTVAPLVAGGCLCIPSEYDRRNNLASSISAMKATSVSLTPSVARLVSDDLHVDTLILLGEGVSVEDTKIFWGGTRIINAYGPAECTPNSVLSYTSESPEAAARIGKGAGAVTWVVNPDDHDQLVPIGAIGELLLEGPILGAGYLDAPNKTAEAFIRDPPWLQRGTFGNPGRSGRLYKTGDLVRYNMEGSLEYLGRKDTQVKVRGQRVELDEVTHVVRDNVPDCQQAAVELITPSGEGASAILAAFVVTSGLGKGSFPIDANFEASLLAMPTIIEDAIAKRLPAYMVPSVYFKIKQIPMNTSGKTDRKLLRQVGASISTQQLADMRRDGQYNKRAPSTEAERQLQKLFARVLKLDEDHIGVDDSFFRLGGDSVSAMKLVSEARKIDGLTFSVADIFRHPKLETLAALQTPAVSSPATEYLPPFSLLRVPESDLSDTLAEITKTYDISPADVEDAYPCTPLQEGLLALMSKSSGDYILQARMQLSASTLAHLDKFKHAWEQAVRSIPILRTRVVHHSRLGSLQVILKPTGSPIEWHTSTNMEDYLLEDKARPMPLGGL
ncbi:peptide synthetase [Colletotrichum tofieldiae]|nr:peptide synthetase [Colletotrichum tofieldiae]